MLYQWEVGRIPIAEVRERFWTEAPVEPPLDQEVRDFAATLGVAEEKALEKGMEQKSEEFRREGAEIYRKV